MWEGGVGGYLTDVLGLKLFYNAQTLLQNHSLKTFIVLNQKIRRLGNKLTEKERKEYILGYWGGDLGAIASLSKTHRKGTKESLKIVKLYKYPPPLINPIVIRHVFIVIRFILAKGQDKIAEMKHIHIMEI